MKQPRLNIKDQLYKIVVAPKQLEPFKNVKGATDDVFKNVSNLQLIYYNIYRAQLVLKNFYKDYNYLWGIDPSYTNTGLAIYDIHSQHFLITALKEKDSKKDKFLRAQYLVDRIMGYYNLYRPVLVVIEPYGYYDAKFARNSDVLYLLQAELRRQIFNKGGALLLSPTPRQLKYILSNDLNKTDKLNLQLYLEKTFNYKTNDLDKVDAMGFVLVAKYYYELFTQINIKQYNINSLDSLILLMKDILQLLDNNEILFNNLLKYLINVNEDIFVLIPYMYYTLFTRKAKQIDVI